MALQSRSVCSLCQAAGGLASGLTVMQCAWKECQEEASVPDELLKKLKPVGCIRYVELETAENYLYLFKKTS